MNDGLFKINLSNLLIYIVIKSIREDSLARYTRCGWPFFSAFWGPNL